MLLVFDRARVPSVHSTQLSPSSLKCAACRLGDLIMIISAGSIWKYFAILGPKKVVQRHAPRRPSVMQYWRFYDEKRENYFRLRKKQLNRGSVVPFRLTVEKRPTSYLTREREERLIRERPLQRSTVARRSTNWPRLRMFFWFSSTEKSRAELQDCLYELEGKTSRWQTLSNFDEVVRVLSDSVCREPS